MSVLPKVVNLSKTQPPDRISAGGLCLPGTIILYYRYLTQLLQAHGPHGFRATILNWGGWTFLSVFARRANRVHNQEPFLSGFIRGF